MGFLRTVLIQWHLEGREIVQMVEEVGRTQEQSKQT